MRKLLHMLLPLLAACLGPAVEAGTVAAPVTLNSREDLYPAVHLDRYYGPSFARLHIEQDLAGYALSEVYDVVRGDVQVAFDPTALIGQASPLEVTYVGSPGESILSTRVGMNTTVGVEIGVWPVFFSTDVFEFGAFFDGSQGYTAEFGPAAPVELEQTRNFIGLGATFNYDAGAFGNYAIGVQLDLTNIRRDTLTHRPLYASLEMVHRESGTIRSHPVELSSAGTDYPVVFDRGGWWDLSLVNWRLDATVLTRIWRGVAADLSYVVDSTSIQSPPVGPPDSEYTRPVFYTRQEEEPDAAWSVWVEPPALSYPQRILAVDAPVQMRPEVRGLAGTLEWSVTGGALPPGIDLDSATGRLRGAPSRSGHAEATITVRGSNASASTLLSMQVVDSRAIPATPLWSLAVMTILVLLFGARGSRRN